MGFINIFASIQRVFKPQDLGKSGEINSVIVLNGYAHGFLEKPFIDHQSALGVTANQIEFSGLIG